MTKQTLCTIDRCGKPARQRGWCRAHYSRWYRHGDPLGGSTPRGASFGSPARFVKDIIEKHLDGDDCLLWPFNRDKNTGYAHMRKDGVPCLVSRVACEARHGSPPTPEHQALHSCASGHLGCVNPMHLRWGTRLENAADAIADGVLAHGEGHYQASLTNDEAREIAALKGKSRNKYVAKQFGITPSKVSRIWGGSAWSHVTGVQPKPRRPA